METISMLGKIAVPVGGVVLSAIIGGRLFWILVKHFLIKYFENAEKKVAAAFTRIDETRAEIRSWRSEEWRDYKRDVALEIERQREAIKELYDRTDNHKAVAECVEFCNEKNKKVDRNEH